MTEMRYGELAGRTAPERARAVAEAHPLRWRALERHPVAAAVLVVVGMMVALQLDRLYTGSSAYGTSLYSAALRAVLCAVLVWIAARSGLLAAIGLTSRPVWRAMWLWWLPVLVVAVMLFLQLGGGNVTDDAGWLGVSAVEVLFVGFLEELLVRGVVLFLLVYAWRKRKHGVVAAVLASSALFGLAHIVNSLGGTAAWSETWSQVVYAFLIGTGLAALVLRTNTIWIGVLWHAAFDFITLGLPGPAGSGSATETATAASALGQTVPFVVMLVHGLVLVRRRSPAAEPEPEERRAAVG